MKNSFIKILLVVALSFSNLNGQVYEFDSETNTHRIIKDKNYIIETVFNSSTGEFEFTRGGFYSGKKTLNVDFEFNSNFTNDSIKKILYTNTKKWKKVSSSKQKLQGKWLMAGRVTNVGEKRRDLNRTRKTMKILIDGFFQWIAFDTSNFRFFGSGGGSYNTEFENNPEKGEYTEKIQFFSRDNNKVGLILPFEYDLRGEDWYHKGLNSKGGALHEIWHFRK
tara:strand:+ start:1130 stop:1795 length:666 start_codon:yes stop_codon:yes gene_type:complete